MSRQSKLRQKRKHHVKHATLMKGGHNASETGERGPKRTTKRYDYTKQYPKTVFHGAGKWSYVS